MDFKENVVYHCKTRESARIVIEELRVMGFTWRGGDPLNDICWHKNESNTYYRLNDKRVSYGDVVSNVYDYPVIDVLDRDITLSTIHYNWLSNYLTRPGHNFLSTETRMRIVAVCKLKAYSTIDRIVFNRLLKNE